MHIIDEFAMKGQDFGAFSDTTLIESGNNFLSALRSIDIDKLVKLGVLDKENPNSDLYYLINEISHHTLFRANEKADNVISNIWLAKVISKARKEYIKNPEMAFNKDAFTTLFIKTLVEKSNDLSFISKIKEYLSEVGVILVFQEYISNSLVDGACFRLANGIPVIGMSLRFSRLDSFWFTLLHELGHIYLHYANLEKPILDNMDSLDDSELERQANLFAKNAIVDKAAWRTCDALVDRKKKTLVDFANSQNVHPALVAGLIRHELNDYKLFTDLVHQVDVRKYIIIDK